MTKRPMLILAVAGLALALTTGLAYGAGRLGGTPGTASQMGRQGSREIVMVPYFGPSANGWHDGAGNVNRDRERMRDGMQSWHGQGASAGSSSTSGVTNAGSANTTGGSYQGSTQGSTYHDDGGFHHDGGHANNWDGAHDGDCWDW